MFLRIEKSAGTLVLLPRSWESPQRERNKHMSKKTTTIRGHKVTLETDGDWSGCWIESGNYSGSLEVLRDTGCLSDVGAWTEIRVNSGTIAAIENWAEANGY